MKFFVKAFIFSIMLIATLSQGRSAELNKPESVVYSNEKGLYLVSCVGEYGDQCMITVSNEPIRTLDDQGIVGYFGDALPGARGLIFDGENLFALWTCKIIRISMETAEILDEYFSSDFNQGNLFNDLCGDNQGLFYVTDTRMNKLFKIDYAGSTHEELSLNGNVEKPNGILYDEANNRLIVVSYIEDAPIKAVDLDDYTVTTLMETELDLLDGITRDEEGNFYVSSWGDGTKGGGAVYKIAPDFSGEPELVESGFSGPADICTYRIKCTGYSGV